MPNVKDIQRRIKSVKNTGKITRAMEMVSAVKMRKSVNRVLAIRPYAKAARSILSNLEQAIEQSSSDLLEVREVKSALVIVVTSNRGLCGSFNSQIIKKAKEEILNPKKLKINRSGKKRVESNTPDEDLKIDFITVGRKGENFARSIGKNIVATFPELTYFPTVLDIRPLSKIISEDYAAKKYDKVAIVYTDYVSPITQTPKIRQLLPLSIDDIEKQIAEMDDLAKTCEIDEVAVEYTIEPNPEDLLDDIVLRLIEMQIYHAILESNASKESSRMVAMKSATESANDMVSDLTLMRNQVRQMKITQEIAEISAGRAALE